MDKRPVKLFLLAAVLTMLAVAFIALIPPGLSSNEEGVLYVQTKNFALNGSFEIHAPALALGFEAKDLAGPGSLFEARDDSLYAVTPPLFPWVASLFYRLAGERAVDFVPVLFAVLAALVMGLTLDRLMRRGFLYWLLIAAFIVGSPVFMQGLLFSGMSLALLLVVCALWLAAAHFGGNPSTAKLFGASVLMGASMFARPEFLPVALAFHLCTAIALTAQKQRKDLAAILAGCAICVSAFVLHDAALHGRFPGPYLQLMMPFYALSPVRIAALAGASAVSFALLLLSRKEGISALGKAALSILSVMLILGAVLLTAARITVSHLMALFPAVLFVFYGFAGRIERLKRGEGMFEAILAATVVSGLVLGASILHPGTWIVCSAWLPIVPLVILLLALERKIIFAGGGMYVVLAFFCGVAFVNGVQESKDRFLQYKDYNAARIGFLERYTRPGEAILFSNAGDMEYAGPLYFDRIFLVAGHPGRQEHFARRLRQKSVDGMYAWTVNPWRLRGFNPYAEQVSPAFPLPPGSKSCCGKSCGARNYYLVRLDA